MAKARKSTSRRKASSSRTASRRAAAKPTRRKAGAKGRGRLAPSRRARGLEADELRLDLGSGEIQGLVQEIEAQGGVPIGAYHEPLSGRPLLLAVVPLGSVRPTPFQRDLSPAHTKRLASKIDESGSFLDPLIVVRGEDGGLWTPNGRHRLAAAKLLGLRHITILVSPDETLSYRILALNTEKAHNLRDRSREVIRMARALASGRRRLRECDFADQFEAPELLTLGLCYEENGRFAGSAYRSFLSKVDRFSERTLSASLRERSGHAARLLRIDQRVTEICEELREAGLRSPYLRTLVVARINPVRWTGRGAPRSAPSMPLGAALTRMGAAARRFDARKVRPSDLALVAAVSTDDGE